LSSPKSFQGRNLTGTVRLVRDLAADIHTNIQQWSNLHIQGITYLKDITQEKHNKNYSEILQDLCDKLENICDNLVNFFFLLAFFYCIIFYYIILCFCNFTDISYIILFFNIILA